MEPIQDDMAALLDDPALLGGALCALTPPTRLAFACKAGVLDTAAARTRMLALPEDGYRILIDGPAPHPASVQVSRNL